MPYKNPEDLLASTAAYREKNREVLKLKARAWRAANPEISNKRAKKYREANPERIVALRCKGYQRNKEVIDKKNNEWKAANKEKVKLYGARSRHKRRSAKANLPATLTAEEWQVILDHHSHACHYCGKVSDNLTQDHVIPLSKGGEYSKENIVPACSRCNSMKHTKDYKAFCKEIGNRLQAELVL